MNTATAQEGEVASSGFDVAQSSLSEADAGPLRELQQQLLRAVTSNRNKQSAIADVSQVVAEATEPEMMIYLERDGSQQWNERHLLLGTEQNMPAKLQQQLLAWCDDACRNGSVQINAISLPYGGIAVTAPILLKGRAPDAFTTVYRPASQPVDRLVVIHQLIAAHLALWQVLGQVKQAEFEAETTASLMELLANLETAENLREASYRLVNELKDHLNCQRVVLGLSRSGKDHCELVALSGMAKFDDRSEFARVMEGALNEAILRNTLTVWPTTDDAERQGGLAHEKLRTTTAAGCVISSPLHDDAGELVGAWIFLGEPDFAQVGSHLNYIEASCLPVGSRLRLLQKTQRGRLPQLLHNLCGKSGSSRRKAVLAAVVVAAALLCVPMPYKIKCPCLVEPVVRRAVVAPYDGVLQETFVEPGEMVSSGEVLARMDEREIQWELAGLEAEYSRARKQRDEAMADDDVSAAQRAKLEMERLEIKQQLISNRGSNLEIKSPIAGIVITGDLERVEGAPLAVGDSLFEIAPLDKLLVEISIADSTLR